MDEMEVGLDINTNPMQFEDLAVSLASLASYAREGDMGRPFSDMEHLYERSLQTPPDYHEITALTGYSISGRDQHSGRGAWLLMNTQDLKIQGVHTQVWHLVADKYSAPLVSQVSLALGVEPTLTSETMQTMGDKKAMIDIVGIRDEAIWLVQVVTNDKVTDSAVGRIGRTGINYVRGNVYKKARIRRQELNELRVARDQMVTAFPDVEVVTLVLVMHSSEPDFQLYQIDLPETTPAQMDLSDSQILKNSIDFVEEIAIDRAAVFRLQTLLDNELFVGVPPCKGGRTLGTLASAVTRQLESEKLLEWGVAELLEIVRSDFSYEIERDKLRHDVDERLTGQGFFRKLGPKYHVSVKGIARYQYCLAKFTTRGSKKFDLDLCIKQRDRIMKRFRCVT